MRCQSMRAGREEHSGITRIAIHINVTIVSMQAGGVVNLNSTVMSVLSSE